MTQKLTKIVRGVSPETTVTREFAVSPIQTKRDRLADVWKSNAKKAWRTRKRLKAAREASRASSEAERNRKDIAA